jgi:hypothetical protein
MRCKAYLRVGASSHKGHRNKQNIESSREASKHSESRLLVLRQERIV